MLDKPNLSSASTTGSSCCVPEVAIRETVINTGGCCTPSRKSKSLDTLDDLHVPSDLGGLWDPQALPYDTQYGEVAGLAPGAMGASGNIRKIARTVGSIAEAVTYPVIATLVILVALAVFQPEQAKATVVFILEAVWSIFPFLAISVAIAAGAIATNADSLIGKAFTGREGRAIIVAAAIGAFSPFCSCGVIPVIAAFLMSGVPLAPVMAFWISSPIVDPEMFALVWGGLGLEFAIVKTIAAILMGILSGYATMAFVRWNGPQGLLKIDALRTCGCSGPKAQDKPVWRFWQDPERVKAFWKALESNVWFLGRWLVFAFTLESLMVAYIPGDVVAGVLRETGAWAIPLSVLVGVPTYLNGYAAIPLVSGMIKLGVSPAVGLGFMLGGAVTSLPAAMAVWALAKPKLFAFYILLCVSGSLASAYGYSAFLAMN